MRVRERRLGGCGREVNTMNLRRQDQRAERCIKSLSRTKMRRGAEVGGRGVEGCLGGFRVGSGGMDDRVSEER